MQSIKVQCPAKINLTLKVLNRRDDGFHNIESIMQTIDLFDYLTINIENSSTPEILLDGNNKEIPYNEKNLVYKAAKLFLDKMNLQNKKISIYIEKSIPVSAGLAGGSTNAAGTLYGLNKIFNDILTSDELNNLCAELGSDLNVCLNGGRILAKGRGEITEPLKFEELDVNLIKPKDLGISAKEAYTKFAELKNNNEAIKTRDNFKNDLEVKVVNLDNSIETLSNYIIKDNEEVITDSNYFVGAGEHNISIEYGDKSYQFTMFGNYSLIEAETKSNENEFFYTDLIGNGVMNSSGKEDTPRISNIETASNNTYMGEIAYGRGLIFNFYSNKDIKANLMLNASSAYTLAIGVNEDGSSSWAPTKAGDIYIDETFEVQFNNQITTLPHELLEGMEWTLDKKGSYSIFANWKLVNLGEFDVKKGFNSVKLVCIGANDENGQAKLANVDYLKVNYIDNNHTHKLTKIEGKEPTCTDKGINTYYTCACGKMFLDEEGKNEITSLPIIEALGHNLVWENDIGTCSRCQKTIDKTITLEAEHNNSLSIEEFEAYKKSGNYVEITSSKMDGKNQGSYLGSIYKNDKVTFHIYSEIAQKASLNMTASSNYVLNYDANGNPKDIGDAEINKIFTMKVNGKQVAVPSIAYKGQEYETGGWDERFTKWETLKILDIDLEIGDNQITLDFLCPAFDCPTHPWGGNSDMTINIDKISINYLIKE